ncbi:hypothetical protein [Serratia marcescens]|uniref:hypothetical protein n=1 Tax=Serratia marcescens TaxID=615 RepID=UPI0011B810F6|nr:hypothetical protein [Serratia marcescens]
MSAIDYETIRNEMGLAASPELQGVAGSDIFYNFGAHVSNTITHCATDTPKLKCSNKTVGYVNLHVSNATKA